MPSLPTTGAVVLGGVTFTSNPMPYEPYNWPRRVSFHMTIGGGRVIQDFGLFQADLTLKLGSGPKQFLTQATMQAIQNLYLVRGAVYALTDWLNNAFTVFITNYIPVPFKTDLWTYTMELQATAISQILGVAYTGA